MNFMNAYCVEATDETNAVQKSLNMFAEELANVFNTLEDVGLSLANYEERRKDIHITELTHIGGNTYTVRFNAQFGKYNLTPKQAELFTNFLHTFKDTGWIIFD